MSMPCEECKHRHRARVAVVVLNDEIARLQSAAADDYDQDCVIAVITARDLIQETFNV